MGRLSYSIRMSRTSERLLTAVMTVICAAVGVLMLRELAKELERGYTRG